MPVYSLYNIFRWIIHGWWLLFTNEIGLPSWFRPREPADPPACWYYFYTKYLWDVYCANQRPGWYGSYMYYNSAKRAFAVWVNDKANRARDAAVTIVRMFTGYVMFGFQTFQVWLANLTGRVGWGGLSFASTLVSGVRKLYGWLPVSIVSGWSSWGQIWEGIKNSVKSWARGRYDTIRSWVSRWQSWILNWLNVLRHWYFSVRDVINTFVANPRGFIVSRLGAIWQRLTRFNDNALEYYMRIWSLYATELSSFLDHPGHWIWEKLEDIWIRLW